jgi:hypothetical protein
MLVEDMSCRFPPNAAPIAAFAVRPRWFKIRNRDYSQTVGREELVERERPQEPVAGWYSCVVACAELVEAS